MVKPLYQFVTTAFVAAACAAACGNSGSGSPPANKAQASVPGQGASPRPARRNACALVPREQLEAIAKEKLNLLHNIEEEDKTVCELSSAATKTDMIYVTVYWRGGKELARVNQAATSMAKQMLNDEDVDIEELTGSGKVRGLADRAYFSDLMPSWFVKGDVMVEVISPRFGHEQTKAVFMAVAKKALPAL